MKVAVVGSGCAGLAATWALNEHSDHEVHLYESADKPGGHANTVMFVKPDNPLKTVEVDSGFIVLNPVTYPNFLRFLKLESIPIIPTQMTFSVSKDLGAFEWAGDNLFTVFCQIKNILDPSMWRLLWDILRFNSSAIKLLQSTAKEEDDPDLSIGEYLQRESYSKGFRDNYLLPMTAAVWSTPPDTCATMFPARTLIKFMHNHHLLQIVGRPSWLTILGGSQRYVERIVSRLPDSQLHLSTSVSAIETKTDGDQTRATLTMADGHTETYDHVILACHSDTSLSILERGSQVTSEEKAILGSFSWNRNEAILHCDTKLMPRRRSAWSAWNYITSTTKSDENSKANINGVALTYSMNILQHIPEKEFGPVLVTLNPPFEPANDTFVGRYKYDHPVMDSKAWTAQRALPSIQNTRGISYAGAWTSNGFHEDGFRSGLLAAMSLPLSARLPFDIEYPDRETGPLWTAYFFDFIEGTGIRGVLSFFMAIILHTFRLLLLLPVGVEAKKTQ